MVTMGIVPIKVLYYYYYYYAVMFNEGSSVTSAHCYLQVMNYFHNQKKQRGVDSMLLRVYNPILWRALSVRMGLLYPYILCY